jgi:hypothetical protein
MTIFSDQAHAAATTRETYLRQVENSILADLERDLADARGMHHTYLAALIADAAERLGRMG